MTFKEYSKIRNLGWYRLENLPKDVQEDLLRLIEQNDRHIGFIIYHSHMRENDQLVFKGLKIGYYWRTIKPSFRQRNWFWRAKRIEY